MKALAVVPSETPVGPTIADLERAVEQEAERAINAARAAIREASAAISPVARSPLFGNGLHGGFAETAKACAELDEKLQKIQTTLYQYFHREGGS